MFWLFWELLSLSFHEEKFESLEVVKNFVLAENGKKYFVLVKTIIFAKFSHPYINVKTKPYLFKPCE